MYSVNNVKAFKGRDEEGFKGELFRDGVKIAFFIDWGCKKGVHFEWLDSKGKDTLAEDTKSLPIMETPFGNMPYDSGKYITELVDKYLTEKRLKKHCRKKTLFRVRGDSVDEYRVMEIIFDSEVKEFLKKKFGADLMHIVNERWA